MAVSSEELGTQIVKKAADKTGGSSVDRYFIHVCQYFD
jgi:hypothetical protein